MKRGDVVLIREPGTPAGKARPCVVLQRDSTLEHARKVTVCPLTSHLHGPPGLRPMVAPSERNGLRVSSEIEIDWVYTHPLEFVGKRIGALEDNILASVATALRRWLDL